MSGPEQPATDAPPADAPGGVSPPAGPPPAMPYDIKMLPYGPAGYLRPTKVYRNGAGGDLPNADELAVWEYVKHLEAELAAARAQPAEVRVPAPAEQPGRADGRRRK